MGFESSGWIVERNPLTIVNYLLSRNRFTALGKRRCDRSNYITTVAVVQVDRSTIQIVLLRQLIIFVYNIFGGENSRR